MILSEVLFTKYDKKKFLGNIEGNNLIFFGLSLKSTNIKGQTKKNQIIPKSLFRKFIILTKVFPSKNFFL